MSDSWQPTPEQPQDPQRSDQGHDQGYGQGHGTGYGQAPPPGYPAQPPQYGQPPAHLSGWMPPPPAPKPGVIPLRPLGVAELLDGAITAIRQYPKAILLPSFIVALGVGAFGYLVNLASIGYISDLNNLDPMTSDAGDFGQAIGPTLALSLIAVIVQFIATVLLTGVITVVMSQAVLGRPITAGEAWQRVRPQAWRLLGLALLITLIVIAVTVATTIVITILGILTFFIGFLLLLGAWIPAAVFITYWAVSPAALLLEKSGVTAAMSRAWALTRGAFWRTFGTLVLMAIIYGVLNVAIALPFSAPDIVAPSVDPLTGDVNQTRFVVNTAIATVGSVIVSTVALPFVAAVVSLLYIDRRMRTEGLDITLARQLPQS